jgi:hypothetical protein
VSVRVYIPTTLPALAGHVADGAIPATDEVFTAADDSEESEYAALMAAAESSAEMVAGLPEDQRRRVVVVAEVSGLGEAVPMSRVVAVHVDTEADVDPDSDLAWFATQEIRDLVDGGVDPHI